MYKKFLLSFVLSGSLTAMAQTDEQFEIMSFLEKAHYMVGNEFLETGKSNLKKESPKLYSYFQDDVIYKINLGGVSGKIVEVVNMVWEVPGRACKNVLDLPPTVGDDIVLAVNLFAVKSKLSDNESSYTVFRKTDKMNETEIAKNYSTKVSMKCANQDFLNISVSKV